ncbi:hypothetical protein [Microbacterium dextranolyticum]|uniref:hypothetical protein n=1 Tax=Microbacterium dextranolyticum TaxID=36806 RepID=UPI0031CE6C4D
MFSLEQEHDQVVGDRQLPIDLVFRQRVVELRLNAEDEVWLIEDEGDVDFLHPVLRPDIDEASETGAR